jgi:hypothetical protein
VEYDARFDLYDLLKVSPDAGQDELRASIERAEEGQWLSDAVLDEAIRLLEPSARARYDVARAAHRLRKSAIDSFQLIRAAQRAGSSRRLT